MTTEQVTGRGVLTDIYSKIPTLWKAIYAGIFACLLTLGGILVGDASWSDITSGQWVAVAIAFLGGLGGTWAIPNRGPSA